MTVKEYEIDGTHVHEIDAEHLEEGLLSIIDHLRYEQDFIIVLTHYSDLRKTRHWIDYNLLGEILGVRVGLKEDLPMLLRQEHHIAPHTIRDPEAFVRGAVQETLHHAPNDYGDTFTERADRLLTNRWIGFLVLAVVLVATFKLTFLLGDPISDRLEEGVQALHDWLYVVMPQGWLLSLLAEGVVLGVGSLVTALPNIVILFAILSVLEESGYMARVAYLMDRVMHKLGLHGRSFIPMLMGFDCNVPAIMAARDIKDPKERMLTMLMVPYMSCAARLPVYILLINTFFEHYKGLVLGSIYLIGILCSFAFALVMKHTRWFRSEEDDHVTELPSFVIPGMRSVTSRVWERAKDFLQKISTVVLGASILIWALEYFPTGDVSNLEESWLASIGQALEPLVRPLGFDWKMSVCLMTGLPAKEAIAATFAILYGNDLSTVPLTSASAYAFLIFTLLYFPCVATIATIRKEVGRGWAIFTVVYSLLLAWVLAFAIHTIWIM